MDTSTGTRSVLLTSNRQMTSSSECDRFIPNRSAMDLERSHFDLLKENRPTSAMGSPCKGMYSLVKNEGTEKTESKILAFKNKAPAPKEGYQNHLKVLYTQNKRAGVETAPTRFISATPTRILDAPELNDDYYLNLLDWGSLNVLAIGLNNTVYLWNATAGEHSKLLELSNNDIVTSLQWTADGRYVAVGTRAAELQLWDAERCVQLRSLNGHQSRVGSLAWNGPILSSGSLDTKIFNSDVRLAQHHVSSLEAHTQEVCGLKWSPDGVTLASGGNDNLVHLWDAGSSTPRCVLDSHQAAVKALAWCPWMPNTLATGGGTADRTIKIWNTASGAQINSIDTLSQVSALLWSPHQRELISSHGFSQNQLTVWKYPSMVRFAELCHHKQRVLHMSMSPDGTTVASLAADEQLCLWKVFEGPEKKRKNTAAAAMDSVASKKLSAMNLR